MKLPQQPKIPDSETNSSPNFRLKPDWFNNSSAPTPATTDWTRFNDIKPAMPILAQPIVIGCLSAAALAELLPNLIKYTLIKKANGQAINPKSSGLTQCCYI